VRILDEPGWTARRAAHQRRVDAWTVPHLARRSRGEQHPVEDFLFDYYPCRPARLRRWHPGVGVALAGPAATAYLDYRGYVRTAAGPVTADPRLLSGDRRATAARTRDLLRRTADRPAQLGCFGLHEWAMVYRAPAEQVRHPAWPLRFGPEELAGIVESMRVRCSHYDAYRFFTAPARPLNVLRPTRERQPDLEQPGCLHANMDLVKWAYRLVPYLDSDLLADCFALALDARALDMRASPYDLTALGYPPVRIETVGGRAEYAAAQRGLAERARPLRARVITAYDRVLDPLAAPTAEVEAAAEPGRPAATVRGDA
jgi:hypothetical protein